MLTFNERQYLLAEYPLALRRWGTRVLDSGTDKDRSEAVLRFGLDAMKFLASLAFADYRRDHHLAPVPKVEDALAGVRRQEGRAEKVMATAGTWKNLFTLADAAASSPGLFDIKLYNKIKLREVFEFSLVIETLDLAAEPTLRAHSIKPLLEREIQRSSATQKSSWFVAWDLLVNYRNRIAHDEEYHWLDFADFWPTVTPHLEAAVAATFLHDHVIEVVKSNPICQLTGVDAREGRFVHSFVKEPEGRHERQPPLALTESVLDRWQVPQWRAEIGSTFLLRQDGSGTTVPALYSDFLTGPPPEPLYASAPDQPIAATDVFDTAIDLRGSGASGNYMESSRSEHRVKTVSVAAQAGSGSAPIDTDSRRTFVEEPTDGQEQGRPRRRLAAAVGLAACCAAVAACLILLLDSGGGIATKRHEAATYIPAPTLNPTATCGSVSGASLDHASSHAVFVDSPGQLSYSGNSMVGRPLPTGGYSQVVRVSRRQRLRLSMMLNNTAYGAVAGVTIKLLMRAGGAGCWRLTARVSSSLSVGGNVTLGPVFVLSPGRSRASLAYVPGSTELFGDHRDVLAHLSDGVAGSGVALPYEIPGGVRWFVSCELQVG